jgi:hypothetical protein
MRDFRSDRILPPRNRSPHNLAGMFSIMLLICAAVICQTTYAQTTDTQEKSMKHYAMIFYASRALTPEELKQRGVEILQWAKDVRALGITLDPRSFSAPVARLSLSNGEVVSGNDGEGFAFSNIVFFDLASEEQAKHVAKTHPGLHYGARVEVREWTSPLPQAAARP